MPPHSSGAVEPLTRAPMRRGAAPSSPRGGPPGSPQRSEFEDFLNAYRPNMELPPREEPPTPRGPPEPRVDFGRSIKKLIKRPQGSPSMQNRNRKEGVVQRTPTAPLERERSVTSDVRSKPKRPLSANIDTSAPPTPPMQPLVLDIPPEPKNSRQSLKVPDTPPTPNPKNSRPPPTTTIQLKVPKVELDEQVRGMQHPGESTPPGGPPAAVPQKKVSIQEERWRPDDVYCLIISGNNIGRFLPPRHNPDIILSMRVVPIPERKYHVIMEFEESPEPPKTPTSTSGMMVITPEENPYACQEQMHLFSLIRESHVATMGMLLMNVERITEFPFVTYLVVSGNRHELSQKLHSVSGKPVSPKLKQLQFLAGYEETITVARPPLPPTFPERPSSDKTGYVISLYQVLPGEDGLRFEQNWVVWTGARQIYRTVPDYMGLKRISVHKSVLPSKAINYSLVCEFSNIMDHLTDACVIIDHLRARCCGFTGIYRVLDTI